MSVSLDALFETIVAPVGGDAGKPLYAVLPVPDYQSYFVGKDRDSYACLLITTADFSRRQPPPIRLESLDVQFGLPCHIKKAHGPDQEERFTVIRCRSLDYEIVRYFLFICNAVLRIVGDRPAQHAVASAVHRLAAIFQKTQKPPARTVNGLFGELYLIHRSTNPVRTLTAWRTDETARFDFVEGDVCLDVKATTGRVRAHNFSYEQCNSPPNTLSIVASMFVERVSRGITLRTIIDDILAIVASNMDLALKLHEVTAATLGTSTKEAMELAFDVTLTDTSLRFFNLADVPSVRGPLPAGVSDVRFRSDLSALEDLSVQALIDLDPIFRDLLPRQSET